MQMGNRFAGVSAVVDDEAVAVFVEAELAGEVGGFQKEVA
jgi:hypothetical protein